MKIYVYAICKNEEKYVSSFMESALESDGVYVLDTGSTDNTVKLLKEKGAIVDQEVFSPFRFDIARNRSLEMVPDDADICVCFDLDEVFVKGWRKKLEEHFKKGHTRVSYIYYWQVDKDDKPIISFHYDKIHIKKGYKWIYPVHEILHYDGVENYVQIDDIILIHHPDQSKSRSSYLPLLELSVKEYPESDRNTHYLGREYMYKGMYDKALVTLKKHLMMKEATWNDEKAASCRFIGRIYSEMKDYYTARLYYKEAINYAPHLRDAYIELALLEDFLKNYNEVITLVEKALTIKTHPLTYINEPFSFSELPYDLLSVSYFYTNNITKAKENVAIALNMNPNSKRIKDNYELIYHS